MLHYLPPFCPYTREPSNTPHRGFHPYAERHLGAPNFPHCYETLVGEHDADYVDNHQFSSYERGDLTLQYIYDVPVKYWLGGELVILPITLYVYRRDYQLRWSEIKAFHRSGYIPFRYPPRVGANGTIHSPMNEENFKILARRFRYVNLHPREPTFFPSRSEFLIERGRNLPIQTRHDDFEKTFYRAVIWFTHAPDEVLELRAEEVAILVQKATNTWHLDSVARAQAMLRRIRSTIDAEFHSLP